MVLFDAAFSLLRGNIKCLFYKLSHPRSFRYHPRLRMYGGVGIFFRGKGRVSIGKDVKIDYGATLTAGGGEIRLGDGVGIGRNNVIVAHKSITIGSGTILAPNVLIYDHDHEFDCNTGVKVRSFRESEVVIGKNCWIAANVVILRGTVIGDNCLVGAGCVLKGNYPANSKIVQKRETTVIGDSMPLATSKECR